MGSKKPKTITKFPNKVESKVKILTECQLCEKSLQSEGHVLQHLVHSHFKKEVRERFSHLSKDKKCLLCNKEIKKTPLIHIGATHRKVNEILIEKGLKPVHAKSLLKETTVKQEIKEELATSNEVSARDNAQENDKPENVDNDIELRSKKSLNIDELVA